MFNPLTLIVLTKVASTAGFIISSTFVVAVLFFRKRTKLALIYVFTTLGLMLSTTAIKLICKIPRPDNPLIPISGYGLPSGHATASLFLGLILSYLSHSQPKPLRYMIYSMSAIIVLTIGMSRINYNVHTPLQVLAGFMLGSLWAGVFECFSKNK